MPNVTQTSVVRHYVTRHRGYLRCTVEMADWTLVKPRGGGGRIRQQKHKVIFLK